MKALEIKRTSIKQRSQRHGAADAPDKLRSRIDALYGRLYRSQTSRIDEVGLVEQYSVRLRQLLRSLTAVGQTCLQVQRVGHANHAIEPRALTNDIVDKECLNHRRRVRQSRHLDQDAVEAALALDQSRHHANQIAAHLAAYAAVIQFDDLVFSTHHQGSVDAEFAVFVDDHRITPAVLLAQYAIEQRGFACAKKPGKHSDRNSIHCHSPGFLLGPAVSKFANSFSSQSRSASIASNSFSDASSRARNCAMSCVRSGVAPSRCSHASAHANSISAPAQRFSPRKKRELTSVNAMTRRTRSGIGIESCCSATAPSLSDGTLWNQHCAAPDLAVMKVLERLVRLAQTVFLRREMDQSTIGQRHQLDQLGIGADQVADNSFLTGDHVDGRQLDLPAIANDVIEPAITGHA